MLVALCVMLQFISLGNSKFEGKIVGGHYAKITDFAHSAYLVVKCAMYNESLGKSSWMCGASILNQELLLTAAHCMAECSARSWFLVSVGHSHILRGCRHTVHSFLVHQDYYPDTTENDIGLVRLNTPITFSSTINRVVLMRKPPYEEKAQVAGWGAIDEESGTYGPDLKSIDQYVWDKKECIDLLDDVPVGTFCASSRNHEQYAASGDSGSALVVRGYIQLGLVSFKKPLLNRSVVVYTDTGYFYDWIEENADLIFCDDDMTRK